MSDTLIYLKKIKHELFIEANINKINKKINNIILASDPSYSNDLKRTYILCDKIEDMINTGESYCLVLKTNLDVKVLKFENKQQMQHTIKKIKDFSDVKMFFIS